MHGDNHLLSNEDATKLLEYVALYLAEGVMIDKETVGYRMNMTVGDLLGDLVDSDSVQREDVPPIVAGFLGVEA
jgi:hypothetical protein